MVYVFIFLLTHLDDLMLVILEWNLNTFCGQLMDKSSPVGLPFIKY